MCGRISLITDLRVLSDRFGFEMPDFTWYERYNLAPTQSAVTVVSDGGTPRAVLKKFGLVPFYAKETGKGIINARLETAAEKPSFKRAFAERHCLVLADGFFEWQATPSGKQPWRATLKGGEPFAFAGIWEDNGFAILTTQANALMGTLHDRMPVILRPDQEAAWLDAGGPLPELGPFPPNRMELYRVSPVVNSWRVDDPSCIERVS